MDLQIAFRTVPCQGQEENGDAVIVRQVGTQHLLAVIDGLGHGPGAALVAGRSTEFLEKVDMARRIDEVIVGLDGALRGTRGAQGLVCRISGTRIEGVGVGNVELRVQNAQVAVLLTPGILGAGVRKRKVFEGELKPGTRLAIFSDGMSARLGLDEARAMSTTEACEFLFHKWRRSHDDASLLLADCRV
jgi:negative regulator of sigma-B (phosphoserine phosphatase)